MIQFSILIFFNAIYFDFTVGIVFHYLRCHYRMDKRFIGTISDNSSHCQFDKKALHKTRKWIRSSVYGLPQRSSKDPFLWTSWYFIFLLSSANFTVPLGLSLSCIHHLPKPGQILFLCKLILHIHFINLNVCETRRNCLLHGSHWHDAFVLRSSSMYIQQSMKLQGDSGLSYTIQWFFR